MLDNDAKKITLLSWCTCRMRIVAFASRPSEIKLAEVES